MSTLNGQVLGQAHYATRALLERELATVGVDFPQSVVLNALAGEGGALDRARLVDRMTGTLKIAEAAALTTVAELTASGLVQARPDATTLALTEAGRSAQRRIAEAVAGITARLYGDIPADELAVAGHVLTLVKQRADAALVGA